MNLQEFTQKYALTLHTDSSTQETYVKLPIADLSELGYMQQALIRGVQQLTQAEDVQAKEVSDSIYWLCRILLASHSQDELEGLAEMLSS